MVDRLEPEYEGTVDFVVYENTGATAEINAFANDRGVQYVPTMMLVAADGTEVDRIVGGINEEALRDRLDTVFGTQ